MINITLPDGSIKQFHKGTTSMEIAQSISMGLAQNVLAAKVNGEVWDASRPINDDSLVQLLTWNDKEGKSTFLHSKKYRSKKHQNFGYNLSSKYLLLNFLARFY